MRIKICGITRKEDALDAVSAGVHALGFIFYKKSPRYIDPKKARLIIDSLPPFVHVCGVFVDESFETIENISSFCSLDILQLHGNESPEFCQSLSRRVVKAIRIGGQDDIHKVTEYQSSVSGVLLDTKVSSMLGGTGKVFDWTLVSMLENNVVPIILSGGLDSSNIEQALASFDYYAIDVNSGVEESPGVKNTEKVRYFIDVVKNATMS